MRNIQNKVNEYCVSDLYVGQIESFEINITENMQEMFEKITGDINPMHIDADFAQMSGFSDKLVYGMLTAALFSTLVGVYLPGKNCLFRSCDVEWPNPCYIGDTLTVSGKITDIYEEFSIIAVKAEIRNQNKKKVARAKLQVEVRHSG